MQSEESAKDGCADKKTGDERPQNPHQKLVPSDGNVGSESKPSLTVAGVLLIVIESLALLLWQLADGFHEYVCVIVHWLSLCCLAAGPAPALRAAIKPGKRIWIWSSYSAVCVVLAVVAWGIWGPRDTTKAPWQPPELPKGCKDVTIIIGNPEAGSYAEITHSMDDLTNGPISGPQLGMMDLVKIYTNQNRLYVRTLLPSQLRGPNFGTNQIPFLTGDDLDNQLPATWDRNFSSNAFEIVDENNLPVLQVFYKRSNVIVVKGIFVSPEELGYVVAFGRMEIGAGLLPRDLPDIPERKAIFKYPSTLHRAELAK